MGGNNQKVVGVVCVIALGLLVFAGVALTQVTNGEISGTVTDPSGAGVPEAQVTAINELTGIERSVTTNASGFYVVQSLPPARYSVKVSRAGFKGYTVSAIMLSANARVAVNSQLEVGDISQVIDVVSTTQHVETESGSLGRLIDARQVVDIPLNGRNLFQLMLTIPGLSFTSKYFGSTTGGGFGLTHANGLRFQAFAFNLDGSYNLDATNFGQLNNNVSPDFVDEVKINASGNPAELGRGNGMQINYVTKSGTDEFHGSLFEFFRTGRYNARNFFLPAPAFALAHDFGWTLGGPVPFPKLPGEKKLFFFAGQNYQRRTTPKVRIATMPTHAERAGIITTSQTLRYPANFPVVSLRGQPIEDPSRATPGNSTGRNILPLQYMTANGKAMMSVYDAVEPMASVYIDQSVPSNTTFNNPVSTALREDIIRIDYHHSQKHSLYLRYVLDSGSTVDATANGDLPTVGGDSRQDNPNMQLAHTFVPSPRQVNEFAIQSFFNRRGQVFFGDLAFPKAVGLNLHELFGNDQQVYGFPAIAMKGYTQIPGSRAFPTGGRSWDFTVRDNWSYLVGQHNLKLGGFYVRFRRNARIQSDLTGYINFNPAGNVNTTGSAVLDMLIGNYQEYRETNVDKWSNARFGQFEAYAADTWKVTRKLTLDLGLRFYRITPTFASDNTISTFDPGRFDFANAQRTIATGASAGQLMPGVGKPYNGIVVAGSNFPNAGTAPTDPQAKSLFGGLPRGLYDNQNKFGPRLGFAYDLTGRGIFAIRGAAGIAYERFTESMIQDEGKNPPFVKTVSLFDGNLEDLGSGRSADFPISVSGLRPNMQAQSVYNWNFGFQWKAPTDSLLDVNYVSTQGRHLMRRININQLTPAVRVANLTVNQNSVRPYQGYTDILLWETSASSSYHALQVSATRRYAKDLTYSLAYTWSKALTDAWDINSQPEDNNNYRNERSYANYNRTHVFNYSFIYQFPFFTAQRGILGRLLGGWSLSGITSLETGRYFNVSISTLAGSRRPDRVGDFTYMDARTVRTFTGGNGKVVTGNFWFDPTPGKTFVKPPEDRYGNAAPFLLQIPGIHNTDLALMKNTRIHERLKLQLRLEAFNAFNQVNFNNLGAAADQSNFGIVSRSDPSREIQLGAKLIF